MQKKIHTIGFYTLLFAVYSTFFSVESFYNFEGQINAKDIFKSSSVAQAAGSHIHKITPLSSSSGGHKVRLNKRYHQEDITPYPPISVPAPECRIIPRELGSYGVDILPSIAVTHPPLRGPPVVA